MKATVAPSVFADTMAWIVRAINPKPHLPILSGVMLEAADGQLRLSVFDYDVTCQTLIPAQVDEPGRALLPGVLLAKVASTLPSEPVELALSGAEVTITCGTVEATLPVLPPANFPTIPKAPKAIGKVDGALLKAAATQVVPASDQNSAEPALRCVQLKTDGDILAVAAAQSPWVAERVLEWEPEPGGEHVALLPAGIFHDVARGVGPWPVTVGLGDGIVSFEAAGRTTTVRLVDDARFPSYRRFFDMEFATWATADTGALLEAVRRVALFTQKEAPAVHLDFAQGAVTVRATGDIGRGSQSVQVALEGEEMELAFLAHFLIGTLTAVAADHDTVRVGMNGARKPALFIGDTETPECRSAVMALRAS